jgi:hypothetical protein
MLSYPQHISLKSMNPDVTTATCWHEFTGHRSGRLCNQVAAKEITPAANAANGLAAESTSEEINLTNAIYEKAATEVEISGSPRAVRVTPEGQDDGALERLTTGLQEGHGPEPAPRFALRRGANAL